MKKAFLLIAFTVAGFATTQVVKAQSPTGPKIGFNQDYVDFGEVEYAGPSQREWKFKNEGKEPLIITGAVGSCGCTVPEWPKEPIMPGKEGIIKINYDTKRPGLITKTVTLTTNEADGQNKHEIKVKGNVKSNPDNGSATPMMKESGGPK